MKLLARIPPAPSYAFRRFEDGDVEQSIPRRFEQQARAYPDRLAVQWDSGSYDYAALNATANRMARELLARGGNAAEPVALMFELGGEALAAIMAVLKAGKFYVFLDPDYPPDLVRTMLDASGARLMVTDARWHEHARQLCRGTIELLRFDQVNPDLSQEDLGVYPAADALATIIYTSGSTGGPKGVLHSHRSLLCDARNHVNGWGYTSHDRHLLAASLSFASSPRTIYGSLLVGAAALTYDVKKKGFAALTPWLLENEITVLRAVPTFFRSLMKTLNEDQLFPTVRVLAIGGESMLRSDLDCFNRHFLPRCVLAHSYGPTESMTVSWVLLPHGTQTADGKLPIGRGLPDKEIVLLDESRRAIADGEVGEIAVRSRYNSPGYWRDPERTREAYLPDPDGGEASTYLTGDLGRRGGDGMLHYFGRRDFQVKIRGYRVEVAQVESALCAMKGIRDAVVVGRETAPGETQLVAYYVASPVASAAPGAPAVTARTLRQRLAQTLPDYMIPSAFVAMAAIPQTPNGKADLRQLPPPPAREPRDETSRAPRNAIEVDLVAIWKAILGVEQLGIDDDFLGLGGDSIKAAQIAAYAGARFGFEMSPNTALQLETVSRMAELVAARANGDGAAADRAP